MDDAVTEKYLWQGLTRLLAVYDGSDNSVMRFEYADARMPVAMMKNGATYYLAYDQVGTLKVVADAYGNVVKKIDYDTFGNIISDSDPTFAVPFGFAGGLHDKDTGLVRFGYRDYDPETGRWTAKDPIGFAGGDTDLYGYCLDDPVNWIDPPGLESDSLVGNSYDSYAELFGYKINHHPETSVTFTKLLNNLLPPPKDNACPTNYPQWLLRNIGPPPEGYLLNGILTGEKAVDFILWSGSALAILVLTKTSALFSESTSYHIVWLPLYTPPSPGG